MKRSVLVGSVGNLDVAREVVRCLSLSGEEVAAFRAMAEALSGSFAEVINGEVSLEDALDAAVLDGALPPAQARLAVAVMAPGRREWSWVT